MVVCVGDAFIEFIMSDSLPLSRTHIVDGSPRDVGGAAFNACWYLAQMRLVSKLIVPFGRRDRFELARAMPRGVPMSGIFWADGRADLLLVLDRKKGARSIYFRQPLSSEVRRVIKRRCGRPRYLLLAGSRHPMVRLAFIDLVEEFRGEVLAFGPSYTVYEFGKKELLTIIQHADVVALNEREAKYVCDRIDCTGFKELAGRVSGTLIVTLAERGARAYANGRVLHAPSVSGRRGDVIGAGDAFLAGYLRGMWEGKSIEDALCLGSATAAVVVKSRQVRAFVPGAAVRRRLQVSSVSEISG